jgi:HEAT repeat protein
MHMRSTSLLLFALILGACNAKPEVPREALQSAAYVKAVALLKTQSRSPDPIVRANCIEALQMSRDPRAVDVIEQGLHDDQWVVRFAAAMASGKRQAHSVLPTLETMAATDPDSSVRAASIYALNRMGRTSHMNDIPRYLASKDPGVRANTAYVLGMLGNPSAIELLQAYKNDPDIRVRTEITCALARLGDVEAQQIVAGWAVNKMAEDEYSAMVVCGDLPANIAESPLILGLEPAPAKLPAGEEGAQELTTRRQLIAARSLAKLRNGSGSKVAIDNLKNPDPSLRSLALLALGEMLTPAQVPGIEPYLDDSSDLVKRAAAAAIIEVFTRPTNLDIAPVMPGEKQ